MAPTAGPNSFTADSQGSLAELGSFVPSSSVSDRPSLFSAGNGKARGSRDSPAQTPEQQQRQVRHLEFSSPTPSLSCPAGSSDPVRPFSPVRRIRPTPWTDSELFDDEAFWRTLDREGLSHSTANQQMLCAAEMCGVSLEEFRRVVEETRLEEEHDSLRGPPVPLERPPSHSGRRGRRRRANGAAKGDPSGLDLTRTAVCMLQMSTEDSRA